MSDDELPAIVPVPPTCILHANRLETLELSMALATRQLAGLETGQARILLLLQGNGKMGIITKAELAYKRSEEERLNKNKMGIDVYKFIMFIILGFIAWKVGLKP